MIPRSLSRFRGIHDIMTVGNKVSMVENVGIIDEPCEAIRSVNKGAVNWRGQLFLNTYDR